MWENLVGRSRAFWKFFFPRAQAAFSHLKDVTLDQWHFAVNDVRPSFIRTESDETTYNLHILLRFELEQAMLSDELKVDDLRPAVNAEFSRHDELWSPRLVLVFKPRENLSHYAS